MSRMPLIVETRGPVAIWRLNNPEIRNPLTAELKTALAEAAERFVSDENLKSLVVTGSEECFCAGGDLRNMTTDRRTVAVRSRMKSTNAWMKLLVASEKPVIMAVNGAAVGAGTSLALVGDIAPFFPFDRAEFHVGGKLLHDTGAFTVQDPNIPYNSASTMSGPYIVPGL